MALRGKDVLEVLQLMSQAQAAGKHDPDSKVKLATGQIVSIARLASHLNRKRTKGTHSRCTGADLAAACDFVGAHPSLPRNVDAPDPVRLPQLIFADVQDYVFMRFSIGPASPDSDTRTPIYSLARRAHSTIDNAARLLADGDVQGAIAQLKVVPEQVKLLLESDNVEPPMTLILIWKTALFLIASTTTVRAEVEGIAKSLVRYTASIFNTSRSLSPQVQRIVRALSELSQIDGSLMYETAIQGWMCMYAQHDAASKYDRCSHLFFSFRLGLVLFPPRFLLQHSGGRDWHESRFIRHPTIFTA